MKSSKSSKNEIFIDVIQGVSVLSPNDSQSGGMSGESYNITVSSSPLPSSSTSLNHQKTGSILSEYQSAKSTCRSQEDSTMLSTPSSSDRGLVIMEHNENTCSSTDSGSSANRFDEQPGSSKTADSNNESNGGVIVFDSRQASSNGYKSTF